MGDKFTSDILKDMRIPTHGIALYFAISDHVNDEKDKAFPSISRLALLTRMSRPTVCANLDTLEKTGWIKREHRFNKGDQISNLYRLPWLFSKRPENDYKSINDIPDSVKGSKGALPRSQGALLPWLRSLTGVVKELNTELTQVTYPVNLPKELIQIDNARSSSTAAARTSVSDVSAIIYNGSSGEERALLKPNEKIIEFLHWFRDDCYLQAKGKRYPDTPTDTIRQCHNELLRLWGNAANEGDIEALKQMAGQYISGGHDCTLPGFCEWLRGDRPDKGVNSGNPPPD
ncbi:MAG: helix-turn-helix domain-containing protein [Acidaminococcales bacterium]|jgi:hypothetical protein|nr:helix-turn-helix domain-containing protein [Acidaminococcales bacterium]